MSIAKNCMNDVVATNFEISLKKKLLKTIKISTYIIKNAYECCLIYSWDAFLHFFLIEDLKISIDSIV